MQRFNDIKAFRELSNITREEVVTLGGFTKTKQYYGQCEAGQHKSLSDETIKEIYKCINIARYKKQQQQEE